MTQNITVQLSRPYDCDWQSLFIDGASSSNSIIRWQDGRDIVFRYKDMFGMHSPMDSIGRGLPPVLAYLTLHLDEENRVTAITSGDSRISIYDPLTRAHRLRADAAERKMLEEFQSGMCAALAQRVDAAQDSCPIQYAEKVEGALPVVAAVFQRFEAKAQGPVGKIDCLGTFDIGPCVGVAVVTRVAGEEFPRVSVGHLDACTVVAKSIANLLRQNDAAAGETEVFVVSGQREDEILCEVLDAVAKHGLQAQCDIACGDSKEIIVDLKTGRLLNPYTTSSVATWFCPPAKKLQSMTLMVQIGAFNRGPLKREFDLTQGPPERYEPQKISCRRGAVEMQLSDLMKKAFPAMKQG